MTGRIHSYLTLSAIDGPGLRFVLFMQGCRLRCVYCHNPDSWIYENGKEVSVDEIISEIKKNQIFYEASGTGGLTISGGEPLFQPEFCAKILSEAKNNGIHTALDTSGSVDISQYGDIITNTDLFILDIKATDKDVYKSITSDPNFNHLRNGEFLSAIGKKLWIRYVLTPGFNDRDSDIDGLIDYLKKLNTVERLYIIPYSKLGENKWAECGYENVLLNTQSPSPEFVESIRKRIGANGFSFKIL